MSNTAKADQETQAALAQLDPPVADLLKKLGLVRYAPVFLKEGIDSEVLRGLTEDRLEKIGVPLGPRIKLLREIEKNLGSGEESDKAIEEEEEEKEKEKEKEERRPPVWRKESESE